VPWISTFVSKGISDETIKSVKFRCGWSTTVTLGSRYANRILAEHSAVNLDKFTKNYSQTWLQAKAEGDNMTRMHR